MISGQRLKNTLPRRLHNVSTSAYVAPSVRIAFITARCSAAGRSRKFTTRYPTATPNQRILTVIDSAASSHVEGSRAEVIGISDMADIIYAPSSDRSHSRGHIML